MIIQAIMLHNGEKRSLDGIYIVAFAKQIGAASD
jgi:hypothetical protein